jgi:hypothetical protein
LIVSPRFGKFWSETMLLQRQKWDK